MQFNPYSGGVLKKDHHRRLVADLRNYALDAGVPVKWICTPLVEQVPSAARSYLREFNRHVADGDMSGIVLTGQPVGESVESVMASITGALVRNFIRARIMTLGSVVDKLADGTMPRLTGLLIPNFFTSKSNAGGIAHWQIASLYDMLVDRDLHGHQTIIHVTDMDMLEKEYGLAVSRLLRTKYIICDL